MSEIVPAPLRTDPAGPPLHLAAREDLRKSGLDDATIRAAGLFTPAPADLPRLLTPRLARQVEHVLVFPYPDVAAGPGGSGIAWPMAPGTFYRCKLFPPVPDGAGHTIRYHQPPGTAPRLYLPPRARAARADPAVPLLVTEGEKKSLKADQEGLACLAIGGLWSWRRDGQPIGDLERIDWCERETLLVPDADVWTRGDLLQPVFALARDLEGRGARAAVVKLPAGEGGAKAGLDDYLRAHDVEAFGRLPRLGLRHAVFGKTATWWREWKRRKEETAAGPEPSALELLQSAGSVRLLHPAQDVAEGVLWYGLPVDGGGLVMLTSGRQACRADQLPGGVALRHTDPGSSSVSREAAIRWLGGAAGSVAETLDGLAAFIRRYVALRDPGASLWLGAWALGTWCYRAFRTYPYLSVRSAERRCGKTRLMRVLGKVGFNASPPTTHPTETQLYREAAQRSGLQAFDEMEGLRGRGDADRLAGFVAVLNVGFEQGGVVARQEKRGDRFVQVQYEVYAPRVIAAIAGLRDTLQDRSLVLVMYRRRRDEPVGRLTLATDAEAQALRDGCALACLARIEDILVAYGQAPKLLEAEEVDDRAVDLWAPLVALALVADAEAGGDRTEAMLRAARELGEVREIEDEGSTTARLVTALEEVRAEVGHMVTPAQLLEALRERGFAWLRSTKGLAGLLAPLGLLARAGREGRRRGRFYGLDRETLADLGQRYDPAAAAVEEGREDTHAGDLPENGSIR
jgi:hypothetical protein